MIEFGVSYLEFALVTGAISLGIIALWIFVVAIINVWPHLDRGALKGVFWVKREKGTGIVTARATFRAAFRKDPDFRRVYQDNIAMLLHDHHGIVACSKRNAAANDIINLVFGK